MRKREKLIQIRVSEEEYDIIAAQAKACEMQIGPYIRMVAQHPIVYKFDYDVIAEHTREVACIRTSINRLIFTIDASNNYLPRDIDSIVMYMSEIFKSENKLLKTIYNEQTRLYEANRAAAKKKCKKETQEQ